MLQTTARLTSPFPPSPPPSLNPLTPRPFTPSIMSAIHHLLNRKGTTMRRISETIRHLLPLLPLLPLLSCRSPGPDLSPGVSRDLAQHRSATISDIRYGPTLRIPESPSERIHGLESVALNISDSTQPLVLDFRAPAEDVLSVHSFESELPYEFINGHIVVPPSALNSGSNVISIEFLAGDLSLNRNEQFMYTLFVPDRASTAFVRAFRVSTSRSSEGINARRPIPRADTPSRFPRTRPSGFPWRGVRSRKWWSATRAIST